MPSMMIHLLAAHKLCADKEPLFCVGTVAPDAVKTREKKDITHFRTAKNRVEALTKLAHNTNSENPFDEGILFHLYLDYLWDKKSFCSYKNTHKEDGWFFSYRSEIAMAGSYIYHNTDWSGEVFKKMLSCLKERYGKTPGASSTEVYEMIKRNNAWHQVNNIGPSSEYTPEFVEKFTDIAAEKYLKWRKSVNNMNKEEILNNMGA